MSGWNSQCGINGGTLWLYDDIVGTGKAAQYASAINNAIGGLEFTLSGPQKIFLNQNSTTFANIVITDMNGFNGSVVLTVANLPKGVQAKVLGTGNLQRIVFRAGPAAATGFSTISVTGTSGNFSQALSIAFAVSAATGATGTGTPIDLSSAFNLFGIYTDGTTYSTGGIDGGGYSYSANLLSPVRTLSTVLFDFGPSNQPDAVGCSGQTVNLPAGSFSGLELLATAIDGNQTSQAFTVTYTDGTSTRFVRNISDWFTPQTYPGEVEAVAMAYRNFDDGTKDARTFNLYSYRLGLDTAKVVKSVTLPNNSHVVLLAATLVK
jgi:hypothetical protein